MDDLNMQNTERRRALPPLRVSPSDLDSLMSSLDVKFVALSECLVSAGHRLEMGGAPAPGIHYNLVGTGKIYIGRNAPINLTPHTLIIVPPNAPFRIEVSGVAQGSTRIKTVDGRSQTSSKDGVRRFIAGSGTPEIILICGFFQASYGSAADLFATLTGPIVEQFAAADQLDFKLKQALTELVSQEVGSGTMSSALLMQVIVSLVRRSLTSLNCWVERFSILSDPPIARAFAELVSNPAAPHSIESLSRSACLSRSAFMARFVTVVGKPPMIVLRELRMRQAAQELKINTFSVAQVALRCGYRSRSSFIRAFRDHFGRDPSEYREDSPAA
jgi:AraC family transcriptional activator of mtrCDE